MIDNFLQYGQWVILILSVMSLYLVSSVKHETRLNGYIFTGIARFSGAAVFIFVDLYAFVIANLYKLILLLEGTIKIKKQVRVRSIDTNSIQTFLDALVSRVSEGVFSEWE